ncbi:MAG: transglutaminase TgpA family protein [Phycisphaeraceae bacterium]
MKMLRHFERLVMLQVIVSISAFCIAERDFSLMLGGVGVVLLAWAVRRWRPGVGLPQWLVTLLSLGAVGLFITDLRGETPQLVTAAGQFVMTLLVIVLWGPKGNREYGQLMVLSLLLMIAAAVLTVELAFGAALLAYCLVALLAALMLEIKSTGDRVTHERKRSAPRDAVVAPAGPVTGRKPGPQLRSTALALALVCAAAGSVVFFLIPRGGSRLVDLDAHRLSRKAGFQSSIDLSGGGLINDDPSPVMSVSVSIDGKRMGASAAPLLMRGAVLDQYHPTARSWEQSASVAVMSRHLPVEQVSAALGSTDARSGEITATVVLKGVSDGPLFMVMPPTDMAGETLHRVRFNPLDLTLASERGAAGATLYRVSWPAVGAAGFEPSSETVSLGRSQRMSIVEAMRKMDYATQWPVKREQLRAMAEGVLAEKGVDVPPANEDPYGQRPGVRRAVSALSQHLREAYTYDLDVPATPTGRDPVLHFLMDSKRGHCEMFASGLAGLCRSLGIPTRVVTGYRVSEYNRVAGEFVVRRRHAHAWNEVYLGPGKGWHTVDATPPLLIATLHESTGAWWQPMREVYEYLEFRWVRTVVAYDRKARDSLVASAVREVEAKASGDASWLWAAWRFVKSVPQKWSLDRVGYSLLIAVTVMLLFAVAMLIRNVTLRRKRVRSLQLGGLPRKKRWRMVHRLKFYVFVIELLERYGYFRPEWQSPRAFANHLAAMEPDRFEALVRLTDIFYEIRFGHREVKGELAHRIRTEQSRLAQAMSRRGDRTAPVDAA